LIVDDLMNFNINFDIILEIVVEFDIVHKIDLKDKDVALISPSHLISDVRPFNTNYLCHV